MTESRPPAALASLLTELGVPADYPARCGLPLQHECQSLVEAGQDVFGRPVWMAADTRQAWQAMLAAAAAAGVSLQLVSAFRSIDYQRGLIARKLARGQTMAAILAVNAAPGYSEHHTGRALDLGTPGYAHLEREFENSPAFAWLMAHAGRFGFHLSFPVNNPHGMLYEPWHWCYTAAAGTKRAKGATKRKGEG